MKIANWERWQSYRKDRGTPPWIKVWRNLLSNPQWVSLTDSEKGQLVSIWLLASDKNGEIPDDPKILGKMALLDTIPNVNKFKDLGFMVTTWLPTGDQLVTSWLPHGDQVVRPETETETETYSKETKTESEVGRSIEKIDSPKPDTKRLPLASDFQLSEEWLRFAVKERGIHEDLVRDWFTSFKDYYLAEAKTKQGKKSNWFLTWKNWVRRERVPYDMKDQKALINNIDYSELDKKYAR